MQASNFFVPSFLKAITENMEESFKSITTELTPGVYSFEMLQPHFCELLLSEVLSFFLFSSLHFCFPLYISLYYLIRF